jgi:hypothetical protein
MKILELILFLALLIPIISVAQTNQKATSTATSDKIEAYYFHFSARCVTCKTVEAQTRQDIEMLYPEKVKSGKMSFQAINLDDASSKAIAEKLQISGQTLLLVKGNQKINITNEGFLYAVSNPEKLKSIIKTKVDGLLKL